MTNPTLLAQDTSFSGWSVTNLMENILASKGLTLDSTTMRVVASTSEQNECRARIHRAVDELTVKWPSTWLLRSYSVTWTSGDHSITLPQNLALIKTVFYAGIPITPLSDEDYIRYIRSDALGGGVKSDSTKPLHYKVMGVTTVTGGTPDPYYQRVVRIFPTPASPDDGKTFIVDYLCRSPDFASANDANMMELDPLYVQWVAAYAKELWGTDENDSSLHESAFAARTKIEDTIFLKSEGTGEYPDTVRWGYPILPDNRRGS